MHLPHVAAGLAVLPPSGEIQRHLAETARVQRILRGLLKLSLQAEQSRRQVQPTAPPQLAIHRGDGPDA